MLLIIIVRCVIAVAFLFFHFALLSLKTSLGLGYHAPDGFAEEAKKIEMEKLMFT